MEQKQLPTHIQEIMDILADGQTYTWLEIKDKLTKPTRANAGTMIGLCRMKLVEQYQVRVKVADYSYGEYVIFQLENGQCYTEPNEVNFMTGKPNTYKVGSTMIMAGFKKK